MSERPDALDDALNEALTSYGFAPANEGLEQRVLLRVRQRAVRARRVKLSAVMFGLAACAACLAVWWVTPSEESSAPPLTRPAVAIQVPESVKKLVSPLRGSGNGLMLVTRHRRSPMLRAEPKLPEFPSASPLGDEERALLQLARYQASHSTQEQSYLGRPIAPIEIAAVEITEIGQLGSLQKEKR